MATHKAITQLKPSGPLSLSQIGPHTINDDQLMVRMEAIALNVGVLTPSYLVHNINLYRG